APAVPRHSRRGDRGAEEKGRALAAPVREIFAGLRLGAEAGRGGLSGQPKRCLARQRRAGRARRRSAMGPDRQYSEQAQRVGLSLAAQTLRRSCGPTGVDGFDQDERARGRDKRTVIPRSHLAAYDFNRLSLLIRGWPAIILHAKVSTLS